MRSGPVVRATVAHASAVPYQQVPSAVDAVVGLWSAAGEALQRARRGNMAPAAAVDARVAAALDASELVSFDVFDTLVTRACARPSDVFLFLALEPPFRTLGLTPADVRTHREAAEREVRQARFMESRGDAEVTLHEIHAALATRLGLEDGALLAEAELAVERRLLRKNARVCNWLDAARARRTRVLAISDTWYSAAHLHQLLAHVGIDLDVTEIVTSADHRASKQEGSLFAITQRLAPAARAASWLHIGDHPVSDDQVPRRLGIAAILHPFQGAHIAAGSVPTLADSVAQGLGHAARHRRESPAWHIGYRTLGPLMLGFAQWIGEQARRQEARRVVFMLRDGLLFERICRTAGVLAGDVDVVTMPSSRRAALMPALLTDPAWTLPQLLAGVGQRPIREYLERLGVATRPFANSLARAGVPDLDQLVDARLPDDNARVLRLFTAPDVLTALTTIATRERDALLAALSRAGLRSAEPSMLVDLGWNGTIQKALHRVVQAADGRAPNWHGCYLGTWPGIAAGAPAGMRADGFLCSAGAPHDVPPVLAVGRELLEVLCSSFEGSLLHFSGRNADPVLAAYEFDARHAAAVREVHDGAAAYAADHVAVLAESSEPLSASAALRQWARLTHRPTHEEATVLGALSHSDNVGSQTSRRMASFTVAADDCAGLLHDHELAYWKQGLLGQRTAQGAALSSILWFADRDA